MTAGPLERHWAAFRESALAWDCTAGDLRASRIAFFSAASAVLAELAATKGSIDTIEAMSDELDAFLFEMATEVAALRPAPPRGIPTMGPLNPHGPSPAASRPTTAAAP